MHTHTPMHAINCFRSYCSMHNNDRAVNIQTHGRDMSTTFTCKHVIEKQLHYNYNGNQEQRKKNISRITKTHEKRENHKPLIDTKQSIRCDLVALILI